MSLVMPTYSPAASMSLAFLDVGPSKKKEQKEKRLDSAVSLWELTEVKTEVQPELVHMHMHMHYLLGGSFVKKMWTQVWR